MLLDYKESVVCYARFHLMPCHDHCFTGYQSDSSRDQSHTGVTLESLESVTPDSASQHPSDFFHCCISHFPLKLMLPVTCTFYFFLQCLCSFLVCFLIMQNHKNRQTNLLLLNSAHLLCIISGHIVNRI